MKPDIVFFGEGLRDTFHKRVQEDKAVVCDVSDQSTAYQTVYVTHVG